MTKPKQREDDIIIYLIVIISILIETFIDAIKCLISLTSSASTPSPTKRASQSSDTTPISSGKVKTQRLSPSTKPSSITEGLKKEDGGTSQDTPVLRTVSSPRSKRSGSISSTQKSTKSGTSRTSGSRRRTASTTSTIPTTTLSSIPKPNHTTADDKHTDTTNWSDHQPTEHLHVLPESQEEVQEHTVLRTKVSRSKLKG
jgi:hypothetical protein